MPDPNPIELVEQLRTAKSVPEQARIVAALLRQCVFYNFQGIAHELARISVTSGLGRN